MTTFRVNDIIVNRATKKKAMVVDVEHDWRFPVYVIEYQDDIGGTMRFNVNYEKYWVKET
jgi:ABC-type microcin C transport system permease subunit YejE|tara:strand:+ start:408 stop:587 length:180 start_codon:yes stop_codon:yes gene_type:complete